MFSGSFLKLISKDIEKEGSSNSKKEGLLFFTKRKNALKAESINISQEDLEKRTIIHRACYQLKYDIINELKSQLNEENVNKPDIYGNTPIILACKLQTKETNKLRCDIIKILISKKAKLYHTEPVNGWTPLHWVCFNGDLDATKLLLENGAIFFQPCLNGNFPIDLAGKKRRHKVVQYLLEYLEKFYDTIGDFCELDPDFCKIGRVHPGNQSNFLQHIEDIANKEENYQCKVNTELRVINPFTQSIFLRCYIQHCLFWACCYSFEGKMINKFLVQYKASCIVSLNFNYLARYFLSEPSNSLPRCLFFREHHCL